MATEGLKARPIGRILRLVTGVGLTLVAGSYLIENEIWVTLAVLGVVLGETLFYGAMHWVVSRGFSSVNPWLGAFLAVTPVSLVFVLTNGIGQLGTILFVGISLVFSALRADGGCEVMTLPGMILGNRTHLVCIAFSPLDWVEEKVALALARRASPGEAPN